MASLSTGAGPPMVNVYHEESMILPDVSRVLTCLYEKNVKFETIKASYKDILSLQASMSVPVPFYDGPVFLQDSRAICRYLAETYEHQGYPFLLGKDVLERASIEQWLRNEEHAFDPPSRALFCHIAFPLHDEDDDNNEDINREKRKLEEVLEVYEQRLGESDYLAGNKFTLADLVHLPGTHHVITSERFAYLYDSRKNVQKWWNRISARDSWQQVLKDMRTLEEEHRKEEHEKQQQQWQTAHLPQFGVRDIHISHRQQEGTKSQRVLVAPPSTGTIITSIPPAPQEHENSSDHKPSSSIQRNQGGFFTTNEKPQPPPKQTDYTIQEPPSSVQSTKSSFFTQPSTPTTGKTYQRTDQKPSHKDASSPSKTSQISPKETPDKTHLSDFFKVSGYKHEAGSLAKPSPQASSKIPGARQTSEAVAPDKSSPGSAKSPHRITETDYSESESKPFGVHPQVDKNDTHKLQTPYGKPPEQRVADSSVGPEAGEKQKSTMSTPYAQVETAKQSIHAGSPAIAKGATEADQDQAPSSRAQEVQSGVQDAQRQAKDGIDENERFSTKRLRRMFNPDAPDSQDPAMEEEASAISSDVYDREKHATTVPANKMSSSPPTGTRAPYTPEIADERRATSPPNGVPYDDRATAGPEKTPPVQQVPPAAPSTDKLAKTEGADTRAPQQTPTDARSGSALLQRADPRARVINDEQIYKSSTMGRKPPEATRKASDSQGTSEVILDTRGKGHEEIPGFRDTGNRDATKKSVIDKRTAELTSGSQQITEPIKGVSPTSSGTPGDKSTRAATAAPNAAVPAPVQEPTSGGQNASAVLREGNLDASGKNEAAKPSPGDPRSMLPATPGRLAPNPDTQFRDTSGQFLKPSPQVSFLSDTRNEKAGIAETSQTSLVLPNDQPGMQASRNAGAASSVPPPVKSPEDNNKTYKEEAATQELPRDQSRTQLAENKKQGDDAAPTTRIGKREDGDSLANTSGNNTIQAQGTTNDVPSKLQIQSDQNKPQLSKDGGKKTKETANSPSLSTSKEVLPSPPEKTKQEQQLQGDQSGMSLQYSVKQGSEAASLGSGTVQQKKKDLSTDADKNYEKTSEVNPGEKIPSDTQQVKSNRSNSKATQFEGEKGNLPESERRGS